MQALALGLLVASIVLVRGGIKGLNPVDSFRDVFSHIPTLNVAGPTGNTVGLSGGSATTYPPNVEKWRPLVAEYFPPSVVDDALSVMQCESGGNPSATNPTSGAAGLFQHLPKYWEGRSRAAGVAPGTSIYDSRANVRTAAWLYQSRPIPWQDWECKPA